MSAAPQLHWSQISMYTRCAEQFRRRYIMGEILPPGVGSVSGTGMHRAVELDLARKIETGELAPEEEVTEAARDSVVKSFDSPEGVFFSEDEKAEGQDAVKAKAIDAAVICAATHHKELAPLAKPKQIERKWVLDIDGFPFGLGGTIDCDDGDAIWDWKTAAKTPAAEEIYFSGQMTMYSLAKFALDGSIPVARLGYVVKTKTPYIVIQEARRKRDDFFPLMRALERIADGIDKEVFPFASSMSPRPWWCHPKWCGYYNDCEGVSRRVLVSTGELHEHIREGGNQAGKGNYRI